MMRSCLALGWAYGLWPVVQATVFQQANPNASPPTGLRPRASDPADFGWIKRWAAVGDSFTAGIGSGAPLGNPLTDEAGDTNWYCARYDTSYPMIVNEALGSSVEKFQFKACSDDRSGGIYKQIQEMEGNLDLVMLTAGGNDLCLASMIDTCVFRAVHGEQACTDVISIAEKNLESILKSNLEELLEALNSKMNDNSVVVFNGYAQFFNTENDDCSTKQDWIIFNVLGLKGLTLTIDRRKSFNNLVVKINALIKSVVEGAKDKYKYKIGFSNWDVWPSDGVRGQFCDPSSSGEYPDPKQPDLQFFKMDTRPWKQDGHVPSRMITRRDALYATYSNESIWVQELFEKDRQRAALDDIYNSLLYVSADPRAEARHVLDRRNPSPPQCPGDKPDVEIQPPSIGLPNFIGKNFHPNELGHYTIASFALQTLIDLRAEVLDVEAPTCQKINEFTCWQTGGSHKYTSEPFLSQHKDEFCDGVTEGDDKVNGWTYTRWFGEGTPDETEFRVLLGTDGTGSTDWSVAECKDSMRRITHGCDGNDKENPMNWKFGGEWKRGRFTYQINPKRDNRPWPVPKEAWGSCEGWYHGWWSSYVIKGKGWATNDWGQKEDGLLDKAKGCIGGGLTMWRFKYFDKADENGNEWQADFNTPIWVRGRCFGNNKAVREAGGFTNGCGGND